MKVRPLAAVAALVLLATPAISADPRTTPWIEKARAAVGPEAGLNQLRSIHFTGKLETTQLVPIDGDATKTREEVLVLGIDIIFQKPDQQRMVLRSDKVIETTALDGYDAWLRRTDAADEKNWQLTLLDAQQVRRLRANTWENLSFYSGIERRGGRVEFGGESVIEGRNCVKLVFAHADNIVFTRFFDQTTGRLVRTVTESGSEIREEGEIFVQGLRFPRRLVTKAPNGQVATITFDAVILNEGFPADTFAVPALTPRR